jgi:hypothetical protein
VRIEKDIPHVVMQHISCMIWKEWHAIVAVGHKQYHAIATVQDDDN